MGLQILRSPVRSRLHPSLLLSIFLFFLRGAVLGPAPAPGLQWTPASPLPCPCGPIGQGVYESEDWGFKSLQGYVFLHRPTVRVSLSPLRCERTRCWGISSIGRVRALQARGTGIETLMLHAQPFIFWGRLVLCGCARAVAEFVGLLQALGPCFVLGWPSGPRRLTQVQVSSDAWVRIPLQA